MKFKRLTVYVRREQAALLDQLSEESGQDPSALVRALIDCYGKPTERVRAERLVGQLSAALREYGGHSEQTKAGMERARRAGVHVGRPLGPNAPLPEDVARMRAEGVPYSKIAERLGCTIGSARRAFERGQRFQGA